MSEPRPLFGTVYGDGHPHYVAAWFGPDASEDERTAIESALRSVEFRPTHTDRIIDRRLIVFGPAEDYPVGSVTASIWLIFRSMACSPTTRASSRSTLCGPNGFYAPRRTSLAGTKWDLHVLLQPPTYVCPAEGWRWDRFGNVLEAGAPWPRGPPIF
jgi:hypothetical protein